MGAEDLVTNGKDVVVVEYHIADVFETSNAVARQMYYNVVALPTVFFDGVIDYEGGNNTTSLYTTYLPFYEQRKSILSDFSLDLEGANSQLTDYTVNITVEQVAPNNSQNLALMVALTESEIDYYWMGQEFVHYCERLMLPDAGGTSLDFSEEDVLEFSFSFSLEELWINDHCELAVWVQDLSTREVQQAAKRSLDAFGEFPQYDVTVSKIYTPVTLCEDHIEPAIEITNLGSEDLTSLDIVYRINEEPEEVFNWSGSIAYPESGIIELPVLEVAGLSSGTFSVILTNPNGQLDEYPYNDSLSSELLPAENVSSPVTLVLKLDDYPEQTSWELLNSSGALLYSGGDYTDPNVFITESFDLTDSDCYTFNIYDNEGDGLTGTGLYKLMYGTTIFRQGKDFGYSDEVQFGIGLTGIPEEDLSNTLMVYPNPASNQIFVNSGENGNLQIINMQGHCVLNQILSSGTMSIDISNLSSGLYYIRFDGETVKEINKIIIGN